MEKTYLRVQDVKEIIGVSESKAYKIIQALNKELKSKGYIVVAGKVPTKFFKEKYYC
ncbi:transcriptional regulator [Clostridium chromiireducens]|uniref:Transcriptional regulator n=1 Tax=Clostridium chromiireducens TaxID=225345 RepID=A0A964RII7_9CLOT|nr:transcriptional regulator [Clostridium chromiireducens]MVX62266.1 transcriptional regulator [Clostridium chromiireducens]